MVTEQYFGKRIPKNVGRSRRSALLFISRCGWPLPHNFLWGFIRGITRLANLFFQIDTRLVFPWRRCSIFFALYLKVQDRFSSNVKFLSCPIQFIWKKSSFSQAACAIKMYSTCIDFYAGRKTPRNGTRLPCIVNTCGHSHTLFLWGANRQPRATRQ